MSTSPDPFKTLIHDTLNITCTTDGLASRVKEIMLIEIGKLGENPIAVVRKQEVVMGSTKKSNMKAEGQIVSNVSQCYLTVTIDKPSFEEDGTYVCKSYYLDQQYQIEEAVMPINITIGEVDTTAVLTHLLLMMKAQEDQIRKQKRELDAMKEKDSRLYAFSNRFNWDEDAFNKGETMRFSDTITNIGNAYNPTTGLFTVPCDGVYVFFVVALTRNNYDSVNISLWVNGSTVAKIAANDSNGQQVSMNTVVSVKAGDIVQPYMNSFSGSDTIYDSHSYFSGFLLHAM